MFWGNGDSAKLTDEEKQTLDHLRRVVETGHLRSLSPKEVDLLMELIQFYSNWIGSFRLLNSVKNIGLLIGALLAIWWATEGAIIAWISSIGP